MNARLIACRVAAISSATALLAACSGSNTSPASPMSGPPATASPSSAATNSPPSTVPPSPQMPAVSPSPAVSVSPSPTVSISPSPAPSATRGLTLAPSSVRFDLQDYPTQTVTITKPGPIASPLVITYAEPAVVGISDVAVSGSTATFTLLGIAGGGDTDVRATDASGATGTLHLTSGLCGRPDNIPMVRLVSPADTSTDVSTAVGSTTVAIYSPTEYGGPAPLPKLHVIVGSDRSFESGSFTPASGPPSGSATAPPYGGYTLTYETATLPQLAAGTTYAIEPYDDACQSPHVAGSFTT